MSFWSNTTAAPTFFSRFSAGTPRYIRTTPAPRPLSTQLHECTLATSADVPEVTRFWRAHYGGEDWILDADESWVANYVGAPGVLTLLLRDTAGALIGTILSTPLGRVYMSHGDSPRVCVIEGLCVRGDMRAQGVAGHLIAWMDHITSMPGPVVHLWMRELTTPVPTFLTTAIAQHCYAYIDTQNAAAVIDVHEVPWPEFQTEYRRRCVEYIREEGPMIVSAITQHREKGMRAWRSADGMIWAAICDTRRRTRDGRPIQEVVWCDGSTDGAWGFLQSVARHYQGVLFASSGRFQGSATADWGWPWVYGRSGHHAWYIYNYIPPAFGLCDMCCIRDEV